MTFTLHIRTDCKKKSVKDECMDAVANVLRKYGYFDVGYDPNEIDIDKIGIS